MWVKQINVFLTNQSGRLAEVTDSLAKADIDIRALYIADTTDFGILRLIVDKPSEALIILQKAGFTVSSTAVIALAVPDKPGTLDKALSILTEHNISLEYLYAFVGRQSSDAVIVIRVDNAEEALGYFHENGIKVLSPEEVYGI
ncbi:MAG: acetolactate synthase [Clostridiales bacterium]|nr:acetolactate synthase [Clostridiales bacterium]